MPQEATTAAAANRAAQFRKQREQGEPLDLPSGAQIMVRRVPLLDVMRHENIPHPISNLVLGMVTDGARARQQGKAMPSNRENGQKIIDAVMTDPLNNVEAVGNATLILCSVDPVFVLGAAEKDNEVSLSDVDLADKVFAWNWITGSSTNVESFRGEATSPVAVAPDGEGVQPAP